MDIASMLIVALSEQVYSDSGSHLSALLIVLKLRWCTKRMQQVGIISETRGIMTRLIKIEKLVALAVDVRTIHMSKPMRTAKLRLKMKRRQMSVATSFLNNPLSSMYCFYLPSRQKRMQTVVVISTKSMYWIDETKLWLL